MSSCQRPKPRAALSITAVSVFGCLFTGILTLTGCNHPDKANIELRNKVDTLTAEINRLNTQHNGDVATIEALQNTTGVQPAISQSRLEQMFTVHGLQLSRLTGPDDWDPSEPGDGGIKVVVVPTDDDGDKIKAAGSFLIEAFDLGRPKRPLVGQWKFDTKKARESWYGPLLYSYVLKCPWQERPAHAELTLKVIFVDELTGRSFAAQTIIKVTPAAPMTQPATQPATRPASNTAAKPS